MLKWFIADLHVHTCLSPCGDLKMSPRNIAVEVIKKGIDIVAICDHNSVGNVPAVGRAIRRSNTVVIPGMEICSREEVHVLALFETHNTALTMQSLVFEHLYGRNSPERFGLQVVANEYDEVEWFEERLLIGATDLAIEAIVHDIHKLGGLAIASHIDRESYSVISQLGFVPKDLSFDALEVSPATEVSEVGSKFGEYRQYSMVRNSDAHVVSDIGKCTTRFLLEQPSFREIAMAFKGEGGRAVAL